MKVCPLSIWIVFVSLSVQSFAAVALMTSTSATRNEAGHIASGLALWKNGDVWLYCVNPPLAKMVSVIPLVMLSDVPSDCVDIARRNGSRLEFRVGHLWSEECGVFFHKYIVLSRLSGIAWLWAGGFLVYSLGVTLVNDRLGVFATLLWSVDPLVISHGALATSDMPVTVAILLLTHVGVCWLIDDTSSHLDLQYAVALGICLGLASILKFTGLLGVFIVIAVFMARVFLRKTGVLKALKDCGIVFFATWAVVWMGYGLNGIGGRLSELHLQSELFNSIPFITSLIKSDVAAQIPHVLPPAFVVGLDLQQLDFEGSQLSYMCGQASLTGWSYYYFYGLAVKTPVGHLILYLLGIAVMATRWRSLDSLRAFALLVPLALILGAASLKSGFTNHVRYVLPAIPFLHLVGASTVVARIDTKVSAVLSRMLTLLVLSSMVSVMLAYPNLLGYFNYPSGGVANGWWHLADSNVDWGHDLIRLRHWIDRQPKNRRVAVDIYHHIDLGVYLDRRCVPRQNATHLVVDAYTMMNSPSLRAENSQCRIGSSLFVFEL